MNPDEILGYVGGGMKWLAIAGGSYFTGLVTLAHLSCYPFQKSIKSQEELELVVQEEADKLGLNSKNIQIKLQENACWVNKKGKGYELSIELGSGSCTRKTIKHELYHIYRDESLLEKFKDKSLLRALISPRYLFISEPRAILYSLLNLKT
jgi:hypothetical protein